MTPQSGFKMFRIHKQGATLIWHWRVLGYFWSGILKINAREFF